MLKIKKAYKILYANSNRFFETCIKKLGKSFLLSSCACCLVDFKETRCKGVEIEVCTVDKYEVKLGQGALLEGL